MFYHLKSYVLLVLSSALILSGSALFFPKVKHTVFTAIGMQNKQAEQITVDVLKLQNPELDGAYTADWVDSYSFQQAGKHAFSLLLAHYRDSKGQQHDALLFPKNQHEAVMSPSPTGLRQEIWQAAAKAIKQSAPKDAMLLSWWDDGQRVHYLSGNKVWLNKPGTATFKSPLWSRLQDRMTLVTDADRAKLTQMARWLTMDSEMAVAEIRQQFGASTPVYLLLTNDLLMRLGELMDYGGFPLSFHVMTAPVSENLHGDIVKIKTWAAETGNGNYLVQKENVKYRVWVTPKQTGAENNALLVRLLPFTESLKKLPEHVHLVYQSHWGGYLSIYKITP